ncbi:MAG: hypothetical protein KDG89_05360 [Geminicoccaceae bacterium]|nr:hypothetical protein [Geminicoccaceae bacterium]
MTYTDTINAARVLDLAAARLAAGDIGKGEHGEGGEPGVKEHCVQALVLRVDPALPAPAFRLAMRGLHEAARWLGGHETVFQFNDDPAVSDEMMRRALRLAARLVESGEVAPSCKAGRSKVKA